MLICISLCVMLLDLHSCVCGALQCHRLGSNGMPWDPHSPPSSAAGSVMWSGLVCAAGGQLWLTGLSHTIQHSPLAAGQPAATHEQDLQPTGAALTTKTLSAKWSPW